MRLGKEGNVKEWKSYHRPGTEWSGRATIRTEFKGSNTLGKGWDWSG